MWNRLKIVLAIIAICTGGSILFLEVVLFSAGVWSIRLAALREPVDLFSESCDVSQLEEMDVVSGTVCALGGRYDYTRDGLSYFTDVAYDYVLQIDTVSQTCYMGIRETKGRKELFRNLSVQTEFDVKLREPSGPPLQEETMVSSGQSGAEGEPIFVEGFLFRMNEQQYKRFQTWLEKAGYLEGMEMDRQILPYYIEERNIAECKRDCITGLVWIVVSIVMIIGSAAVLIHWRKKRKSQTHVTIGNVVYEKEQLATVNQLIEHIERMQAIQELSRITGLDIIQAEKIVRRWYHYWY